MKLSILLSLLLGCSSAAETTTSEPCPPRSPGCPSCSAVFFREANPATICTPPPLIGCSSGWGELGGCSCSKCPSECGCDAPQTSEACLACMQASCSPELSTCLSDR